VNVSLSKGQIFTVASVKNNREIAGYSNGLLLSRKYNGQMAALDSSALVYSLCSMHTVMQELHGFIGMLDRNYINSTFYEQNKELLDEAAKYCD